MKHLVLTVLLVNLFVAFSSAYFGFRFWKPHNPNEELIRKCYSSLFFTPEQRDRFPDLNNETEFATLKKSKVIWQKNCTECEWYRMRDGYCPPQYNQYNNYYNHYYPGNDHNVQAIVKDVIRNHNWPCCKTYVFSSL